MAVCVDIVVKDASIEAYYYANAYEVDKDTRTSLSGLINDPSIREVLNSWGIEDDLIERVKASIYFKSNDYKHHLRFKPNDIVDDHKAAMIRDCFKVFYEFMSRYYEHCTGKEAPEWKEDEYHKLYISKAQRFTEKENKAWNN